MLLIDRFGIVVCVMCVVFVLCVFFFQAEDGIRDLVRSRGLGDVYKRQGSDHPAAVDAADRAGRMAQHASPLHRAGVGADHDLSLIHI